MQENLKVFIKKIKDVAKEEIEIWQNNIIEWQVLKSGVRKSVEQLLYHKTKRRPSVFPYIILGGLRKDISKGKVEKG